MTDRSDPTGQGDVATHGGTEGLPRIADLPRAGEELAQVRLDTLAVFIDYDGTLTPIVPDPQDAVLSASTRTVLERLATHVPVAIVSGRDLDDVRAMVGLPDLAYAGSHGFDILRADGTRQQLAEGHLDDLDRVESRLRERLAGVAGARIERKRFAVAVHDRQVDDAEDRDRVQATVAELADHEDRLRVTGGKRIHEFRPDIDWDKGRAIEALVESTEVGDRVPIYIGDDETDEDGFRAVAARGGWPIVVRGEADERRTLARAAVDSPDQVRALLASLLEQVDTRS